MATYGRGFTLLELLCSAFIAALLALGSIWGLNAFSERTNRELALRAALGALDRARSLSVIRGNRVAVCMFTVERICSDDWSGTELAVFLDKNQNRQRDRDEEIFYQQAWPAQKTRLRWSNWRNERAITYQPNGSVVSNGTLFIDDNAGNTLHTLVISKPGRVRISSPAPSQ